MKVLFEGKVKESAEKIANVTCPKCNSILEVSHSDLEELERSPFGSGYVHCPVCEFELQIPYSSFEYPQEIEDVDLAEPSKVTVEEIKKQMRKIDK